MLYNYHTHTIRCGHAVGSDKEYVEKAIKSGIKVLGFADHAPYIFACKDGHYKDQMPLNMLNEYAQSVRKLKKEYQTDIEILLGFEVEYYPNFHKKEMELLGTVKPDYLILGQHYLHEQRADLYVYAPTHDIKDLNDYVDNVLEGLRTGCFLYLAHPDLMQFNGCIDGEKKKEAYIRLCQGAKNMSIPLEINLLGLSKNRGYPTEEFFRIAGEIGNDIVIGYDAHEPQMFLQTELIEKAMLLVEKYNLNLLKEPFRR
ncbi:MAG: histidinol-phosphatase HisJ family protein [Clostridiales bacterium]|nr:histidinol-phosphatase HisJ family protein [Clostridiales bacterium]